MSESPNPETMHPEFHSETSDHSFATNDLLERLQADLKESTPLLIQEAQDHFFEIFKDVLRKIFDDENDFQIALETGRFEIEDVVVKISLLQEGTVVEAMADVGLPDQYEGEAVYRKLLEFNAQNSYWGTQFGVDPETGQIIATTIAPLAMIIDSSKIVEMLDQVILTAQELRRELKIYCETQ